MDKKKFWKGAALVAAVVCISSATTAIVVKLTDKNQPQAASGMMYPQTNPYARFASAAPALDTDFTVAAELSVHAVVHVKTKTKIEQVYSRDPFLEFFFGNPYRGQQREAPVQEGAGSGVIISPDGYIVTNNHVVGDADEIEVTLNDNRTFTASVVGKDPNTDIALIKIKADNLPTIPFGNSDDLKVGEWVLAVGNPFNLTSTVTAGIVSAKARNINILNTEMRIESFIQTDAAVNPGNSGGALVNTRGELVGINTAIASRTGSFTGYSFAVPSSIVSKVVTDIREYGTVQRAVLGVAIQDISNELAKAEGLKTMQGAYVANVTEGSSAEKAGVKRGDIIVNVNGSKVNSSSELQEQIGRYRPGDEIFIEVLRDNKSQRLQVKLQNRQGNTEIISTEAVADILGAKFQEVDHKTAAKLGISYGVQVASVGKGKFQEQGIQEEYIILKINGMQIRKADDIQKALDAAMNEEEEGRVLFIAGVYPNGNVAHYAINLID